MKEGTKTIAALLLTGGAIYALSKMQDRDKRVVLVDRQTMSTSPSNPAFKYPQGTELTEDQQMEVIAAIFANKGIDFKKMGAGGERKISEAEFSQLMNDIKDAIYYYYPNTSRIEKLSKEFDYHKAQFIGGYHANAGYHMGQIDGFANVY